MFSIKKNETTFLYKIDGGAVFISAYIGFSCKHIYSRIFQTLGGHVSFGFYVAHHFLSHKKEEWFSYEIRSN